MPLARGTRIGPYEILEPLGAGGMGEVYRALDSRLERHVAIKVLPDHLAANADARIRFEREAKAVAALSHPNIMAIHDVGDHDGLVYAVMELLEGETLRSRLSRSALTWDDAVDIAIAIAEGLSTVHGKGIVHRDLKPDNVFLTSDGRVKILDFGLARMVPSSSVAPATALTVTEPGTVMGTTSYMSPEQVRGLAAEAPSDVFSLGCVLYEMLAGRRPFDRSTSAETMAAILNDNPTRVTGSGRHVPADLERIVTHCLEKRPHERFQSARDLAFSLRAVASRGAGAPSSEPTDTIDSLAVLPFVNASDSPDTEYLSDGIAESLMNSLSQLPNLRIVPRSRVFRYKGQQIDARKVGRQLKVRALLTGRVLQRGDTLNVQVELVDVATESQLWGERFNRKATDIFVVEDEIARQISERLRLKLSGQDRERLLKRHTDDTAAYHLYLRGRYHWNKRTGDGLKRALEYFQQAIDKDPSYAMAYAGLADGYLVLPFFAPVAPRDVFARGKTAALKALEIDPELSEAYTALGLIQGCLDWDWAGAERSLRRAVELKPESFLAHDHYAMLLSAVGRHEEAVREVRRGLELEPLSLVVVGHHVPWVFIRARMYDDAIEHCRRALEMEPRFSMGHQWLGLASALQSRDVEAIESFETARRLAGNTLATFELARTHAVSGRTADARSALAAMHDASTRDYVEPYGFAVVYAALGQNDEAFQWLDRACEVGSGHLAMFVYQDARLEALSKDPRMGHLLKRMGLALS